MLFSSSVRMTGGRLLSALALLAFATKYGGAFDSFPGGSIHRDITIKGLAGQSVSDAAGERIVDRNYDQDWNEVSVTLGGIKPNENYRPEHHCDRNKSVTNGAAFKATAQYVRNRRKAVVDSLTGSDAKAALDALGQALHARQDFFSHSNFIDLSADDQKISIAALNDPTKDPPPSLKITGYDRETGKDISGDDYAHDAFCKDNPTKNAEARKKVSDQFTKFDWAKEFAVQDTKSFIAGIRAETGEAVWARLTTF